MTSQPFKNKSIIARWKPLRDGPGWFLADEFVVTGKRALRIYARVCGRWVQAQWTPDTIAEFLRQGKEKQ